MMSGADGDKLLSLRIHLHSERLTVQFSSRALEHAKRCAFVEWHHRHAATFHCYDAILIKQCHDCVSRPKQPAPTALDIGVALADFFGYLQAEGSKDLIDIVPDQIGETLHSIAVHAAKLRSETR